MPRSDPGAAIHDKHPHFTDDNGPTFALHLMRQDMRSLDSG